MLLLHLAIHTGKVIYVQFFLLKGGSSGFPSTPAPTPFSAHPGGVRPEDLAAGISRLSVIEESGETIKSSTMASNESSQPNLSQYFGNASEPPATAKELLWGDVQMGSLAGRAFVRARAVFERFCVEG